MSTINATTPILTDERLVLRGTGAVSSGIAASFQWLTRPRRVLLALTAVWVVNLFDLGFTLTESFHAAFVELNPVASFLIGQNPDLLIWYKFGLLTCSSTILLLLRHKSITELGCWTLLGVYSCVAVRWCVYFEHRFAALCDPAINVDPILGIICP